MTKPRVLTEEEARKKFLEAAKNIIAYWAGHNDSNVPANSTTKERLEGCVFSLLVMLDGGNMSMPGFKVIPTPHPNDKAFHKSRGENWWPDDVDIAGSLHEELHK